MPASKKVAASSKSEQAPDYRPGSVFRNIMIIALALILIVFMGLPALSSFVAPPDRSFGSYDGVPITYAEGNLFASQVEELGAMYSNVSGDNVDFIRQYIWRQAFERAALQIALEREALRAGIVITDAELDRSLVFHPAYLEAGQFSAERFRQTSNAEHLRIRNEQRQRLYVQKYYQATLGTLASSEETTAFLRSLAFPQRRLSVVTLEAADYPAAEVARYGQDNASLFRSLNTQRLSVASEGDAQRLLEEARKGEKTFDELVQAHSRDSLAQSAGRLDWRSFQEIRVEFENQPDAETLFSTGKDSIAGPFKTIYGWSLYKVLENLRQPDLNDTATLEQVRAYMNRQERGLIESWLEERAKQMADAARSSGFASAALAQGKTVQTTGFLSLNYGSASYLPALKTGSENSVVADLDTNESFWRRAFQTPVGQIAEPLVANNKVLLIRVDAERLEAEDSALPELAQADAFATESLSRAFERSFLNSPRFEDRFYETYQRLFASAN